MKIRHDKEYGHFKIILNSKKNAGSQKVADNCVLDFDAEGNVIGIEILNAPRHDIDPAQLDYTDISDPAYKAELLKKVAARKQEAHGQ